MKKSVATTAEKNPANDKPYMFFSKAQPGQFVAMDAPQF